MRNWCTLTFWKMVTTTEYMMVLYANIESPRAWSLGDGFGLWRGLSLESNTSLLRVGKAKRWILYVKRAPVGLRKWSQYFWVNAEARNFSFVALFLREKASIWKRKWEEGMRECLQDSGKIERYCLVHEIEKWVSKAGKVSSSWRVFSAAKQYL